MLTPCQYIKRRRERNKELGLCAYCGKRSPTINGVNCLICKGKQNGYVKKLRSRRSAAGLCVHCGRGSINGKSSCNSCHRRHLAADKRYWVVSPKERMLRIAKKGAVKRGIPFLLEIEDIPDFPSICPVLGIKLTKRGGPVSPGTPSLDRIINNRGYCKDNVRVISLRANSLKRDATLSEMFLLGKDAEILLSRKMLLKNAA